MGSSEILEVALTRARARDPYLLIDPTGRPLSMRVEGRVPMLVVAGKRRSSKWMGVRARHLDEFGFCAACGCKKLLNVHHIRPYHLHPDLELELDNLITLCEYHNCHLAIGHLLSWYSYNIHVSEDAAAWLKRIRSRP